MLDIENLNLKIGDVKILNGVSLKIASGETVGLIGPNGSGKTSLFNCISGFNTISSGQLTFSGHELTSLAPHHRAKLGIGRVFQNFGVFHQMTLLENMLVAIESKQRPVFSPWSARAKKNRELAVQALASVRLADRADEKAGSLSGGQMRLLEICRAIAFGSDLFLLDEPTAGVSPKMKGEVEFALSQLRELKKTVLVIEHDINFIQRLCDRILVLDQGKIVLDGAPEMVRNHPLLQEIYFGAQNGAASAKSNVN